MSLPADSASEASSAALFDALRKSEQRYRFLAETIPVQVWTSRPDGLLDYVSSRATQDLGISMERLLSEGWLQVLHPDDVGSAIAHWAHALSTGETYEVEFRLKMADGSYAWHLARAVAQRGTDGAIVEWLGTNTNIAEQREAQRRTQALLDEVASQALETEATLKLMREDKTALERRVRELEAKLARR